MPLLAIVRYEFTFAGCFVIHMFTGISVFTLTKNSSQESDEVCFCKNKKLPAKMGNNTTESKLKDKNVRMNRLEKVLSHLNPEQSEF